MMQSVFIICSFFRDGRLEDLSTALKSGVNCKDIYVNVNPYKNPKKQTKITSEKTPKEMEVK